MKAMVSGKDIKAPKLFALHIAPIPLFPTARGNWEWLFAGLHQRAMTAGTLQEFEEAERPGSKEQGV